MNDYEIFQNAIQSFDTKISDKKHQLIDINSKIAELELKQSTDIIFDNAIKYNKELKACIELRQELKEEIRLLCEFKSRQNTNQVFIDKANKAQEYLKAEYIKNEEKLLKFDAELEGMFKKIYAIDTQREKINKEMEGINEKNRNINLQIMKTARIYMPCRINKRTWLNYKEFKFNLERQEKAEKDRAKYQRMAEKSKEVAEGYKKIGQKILNQRYTNRLG